MRISMIPSNDVKTIHASQNDTQREWSFEPFDNSGTLIIGEESLANIERIKGNTLAFNQLVQNGNFASTSKWYTQQGATQSVSNNVMTLTCSTDNGQTVNIFNSIPAGHKCLISCECKTASPNARAIMAYCGNYTDSSTQITLRTGSTNWERLTGIVTSASGTVFQFRLYADSATNQFRNAMLIDLTQMFGAGKEPTLEQFRALFPLPYYSYQSTLLPFKGTSIKTVGKNQLNYNAWKNVQIMGGTAVFENNGITLTATTNDAYTGWRDAQGFSAEARVPVMEGKTITLSWENDETIRGEVYIFPNGTTDGLVVVDNQTRKSLSYIPTSGVTFVTFRFGVLTAGQTIHYKNIMIRYADTDSTYEPYTSSTTNLPTLTYFPNGMKSAGNAYDELTESKAITRIKQVTITSFQGKSGSTDNNQYYTTIGQSDIKKPTSNNDVCNISANIGANGFSYNAAYGDGNIVGVSENTGGLIIISFGASSSLTTLALANQWVANNPITVNYELATPTETDINTDIFYPVYQYGTEQILPINGANPVTSPFVGDIYYADGLKTDQTFLYRQTPINYNTRQFALVSKNTETPLTLKDGKGYCNSPLTLTNESGFFDAKLKMIDSDGVCYSEKFQIHVERRP